MKRILIPACTVTLIGLAGCAAVPPAEERADVDTKYMAAVEGAARSQGVQVIWVNPPRKR